MSDDTTTAETTEADEQETAPEGLGDAGKKALVSEREARKAAERTAAEYKAKLDEIEQANLSELERAQQRAEQAEAALKAAQVESARLRVASEHGIPSEHLDLITGETEEELTARAERIASLITAQSPRGPVLHEQGKTPERAAATSPADSFAGFIESQLS